MKSDSRVHLGSYRTHLQRRAALESARRRNRRNTLLVGSAMAVGGVLVVLALLVVIPLVIGWILMLILGGLHHSVAAAIPALGYWPSVLIVFALSLVKTLLFGNARVRVNR